ncbi:PAS domain S-box protein [Halorarum halobium]|uniref:PAS domain S-box protein n=1 Tax=Halorarum halobium TaxID=3075121 RepID=UPI0028AE81AD|nr:PAS domain S-box protein [Halobaculum sp. XH14]
MTTPGPTPEITLTDTLAVFTAQERQGTPLTASEVAAELDCTRRTAHRKLEALSERGDLNSKKTGARSRVWWRPPDRSPDDERADGTTTDPEPWRADGTDTASAETTNGRESSVLEQFEDFVDAVSDYAIFALDPDGVVVSWNEGAARIKGYDEEEIVGRHLSVFYTDDDVADDVPAEMLAIARSEGRVEREGWRVRADGSRFFANVTLTAVRDDDGALAGFTKVTRDLTERREYEEALKAERDLLDRTLDASQVGIIITDPDGEAVRINEQAAAVLGLPEGAGREAYTPGERRIYDEDGREMAEGEHPFARVLDGGEPVYDEVFQVERPDGSRRWLSVNAVPLTTEAGEIERVVSTGDDITELKRRTRELETELSEILGRISDAFYALDREWRFTHVNDKAAETLRRSADELRGERIWEAFPEADEGEIRARYERAMETQEPVSFELSYESLDGWFEINAYPSETGLSVYFRDVGERRERKRALEESERRYRALAENFPNGAVVLVDRDLQITLAAGGAFEDRELDPDEMDGMTYREAYGDDLADGAEWAYEAALDGEHARTEVCYDGKEWVVHTAPIRDADGEVVAAMGMSQDITDRKRREEALTQYETVFETIEDGVYVLDPEFRFVEVNDAYAELAGRSRDELVGEPCSITIDDEVSERAGELVDEMVRGERDRATLEGDVVTPAGERVPAECKFTALLSETGENLGSVGVVRDLTDRKAYERSLETRARQQRAVADLGQRALESQSPAELFEDAVETVAEALGTEYAAVLERRAAADELLVRSGVGWRDWVVGEATVDAGVETQAGYTLESPTPVVVEDLATEPRFDGSTLLGDHDVSAGITATIGGHEGPWGVLATHDVDAAEFTAEDASFVRSVANVLTTAIERARYEERLNETVAELRESNERLEQFAYIASHDLQEPLRMISNYLQLLEGRYRDELDDDAREFIDFAVDGAERMKEMIDGLLAYSRVETAAEPFEPVDSEAVVGTVREDLRLRIEETDAELAVGDLPTVVADANQLEQVFRNLVSNALKYRGGEPPRVEIDARRGDGEWVFRVADDGIGIEPEYAERVFEVFRRLHTRDEYPGTGIGLALCEKIVGRHGGRIWVESEPGAGASFFFTVPLRREDDR